jgi:hypothetical protein
MNALRAGFPSVDSKNKQQQRQKQVLRYAQNDKQKSKCTYTGCETALKPVYRSAAGRWGAVARAAAGARSYLARFPEAGLRRQNGRGALESK